MTTLKDVVRTIPGCKPLLNILRTIRKSVAKVLARMYLSRQKYYFWRSVHFESLDSPLALTSHPAENYLVQTSDEIIGKILYCRGFFDFQNFEKAFDILKNNSHLGNTPEKPVLYDIGANIGPIGIPAIKRGYVDRVIAFEPDEDNFRLLRINAILNSVDDKMDCHQCALGAENTVAILSRNESNHGDHRIIVPSGEKTKPIDPGDQNDITTEVRRLDDFFIEGKDSIVWIDVQGYEANVLSGAPSVLKYACPMILEFTPGDLSSNGTLDLLLEQLTKSNYTRFFDLAIPSYAGNVLNRENLLALANELSVKGNFTDILLI